MSLVQANWHPTPRQLRQFGVLCATCLPLLAWWWGLANMWIVGHAIAGLLVALLSWWVPTVVAPLFIGVMFVALPIGIVLSEVVLLLVFGLVFLPMGIAFRLLGRDRLQRRTELPSETYWEKKRQARSLASYYRQS